jgi:predicted ATPase
LVISELHLKSFKCFETLDLPLRPLTLLTGENGGGKSSVIQALGLLSQTIQTREWGRSLSFEGPDLALGSVADVLNHQSARIHLTLGITTEAGHITWLFQAEDRSALSIEVKSATVDGHDHDLQDTTQPVRWMLPVGLDVEQIIDSLRRLNWITAERTGPREVLPLRDRHEHMRVGYRGELAAGLLYWNAAQEIDSRLCVSGFPPTLFHQVRARMQEIFPGCDLRVTQIEGVNAVALRFRLDSRSEFHRPQNVGFGLSQLFPVIVALLAADAGDVLIIENPEVHLHPRAQQMIGEVAAQFAQAGRQVILESHSDHVLNGVRLAVKKQVIAPQNVALHFFSHPKPGELRVPLTPSLDADGRLDVWPEGFFDQFENALAELI